jgi:penicillin-binding protein 2
MNQARNPFSEESNEIRSRFGALTAVVFFFFMLLLTRLYYLQVIQGAEYRLLSENNRTRLQDLLPARGRISDREGRILVNNFPAFDLAVIREDVKDMGLLTLRLSRLLSVPVEEIKASLDAARTQPAFNPVRIRHDLERPELVALETHRYELSGAVIDIRPGRAYLNGGLAAHVIGHLGEVSPEQLKLKAYGGSHIGDLIGRNGLEKEFERVLRGGRGWRVVEADASGRVLQVIRQVSPSPGGNLILTLDARLQQAAEEALKDKAGAIVALDPKTGEVLAMASSPAFNQKDFVRGVTREQWQTLVADPLNPMENRAISGQYMPGSTFKIVLAVAGLEEGLITPETAVFCNGGYPFGNRVFRCWKKGGHGSISLHRALVESCDVYFYDLGRRLGVDRIARYAKLLGLGEETGIELSNEKAGLIPTREWKKQRFNVPWMDGETLSVAIGQGYDQVTPLQMARMLAAVVNGGTLYRPYLVKKVTDLENRVVATYGPKVERQLPFKLENLQLVVDALTGVVQEPGGTGRQAQVTGVTVGGKTGTAQVVPSSVYKGYTEATIPYLYRDHAWFLAFAPREDPRIVVVAIAEHAGHGGSIAAPMARQVLEAFFHPPEGEVLTAQGEALSEAPESGPAAGGMRP